jgi:hypothetical protein
MEDFKGQYILEVLSTNSVSFNNDIPFLSKFKWKTKTKSLSNYLI